MTPTEAELAAALVAGQSLAEHAETTGRQLQTVRKTLKEVFANTQTTGQAALIARLLLGPATLHTRRPGNK